MEVLLAIGLCAAFFWILAGRKNKHGPPPTSRRVPPKVRPVQNRAPFQAKTAHKVSPGYTLRGKAYVVDGDTVVIQKKQIRLYGIDAPEMDHPYGKKPNGPCLTCARGMLFGRI
ncbi:hypothetical protein DS901_14495 [Loktanella sp. D2R18]|nr:hypothetical protein DS901_14495 [Loktanella sp. D2R18]